MLDLIKLVSNFYLLYYGTFLVLGNTVLNRLFVNCWFYYFYFPINA